MYRYDSAKQIILQAEIEGVTARIVIAKNGSISAATLVYIEDALGYYISRTSGGTYASRVTSSDTFSENATFYLIAIPVDYSGKPFVGKYYSGVHCKIGLELKSDGTVTIAGYEETARYTAKASGSDWILSISGNSVTFSTSGLGFTLNETAYKKVASGMVVVTLKDASGLDESYKGSFSGDYVVNKGNYFDLIFIESNAKLVLSGYTAGTSISADAEYTITGVVINVNGIPNGVFLGNYLTGCFAFDPDGGAFAYSKDGTAVTGTFSVVDLTEATMTFSLVFISTGTAETGIMGSSSLKIESGDHAGTYSVGEIFEGMPFLGTYTAADASTFEIRSDGTAFLFSGPTAAMDLHELTLASITGKVYVFDMHTADGSGTAQTETVTVDLAAKTLVYNDLTYNGDKYMGEPFLGTFGFKGQYLSIASDGVITNINGATGSTDAAGTITGFTMDGGVYTISIADSEGEAISIEYDSSIDGYAGKEGNFVRVVAKDVSLLAEFDYTGVAFTSADKAHTWRFDGYGSAYIDDVYAGAASSFTPTGFSFLASGYLRVNGVTSGKYYFLCTISGIEKSLAIDTTASPMSLTYDEATYLAPKYLGQPFVGDFILNGASIVISEDGSVTIPGLSKGTISYFSEASGVYTIVTTKATIT